MTSKTGMFDGFDQLDVRMEERREKSMLEIALDFEKKVLDKYGMMSCLGWDSRELNLYNHLFHYIEQEFQAKLFDHDFFEKYIQARDNSRKNDESLIRGMYLGILLEMYCDRTDEPIVIDGKNKVFHYLFYGAKKIKNLTLENISGDKILKLSGSAGKTAENISLRNVTGDEILFGLGSDNGIAKYITLNNIRGNKTLENAGSNKGSIKNMILNNIKGDRTLTDAGRNGGSVSFMTLNKVEGRDTLWYAGSDKGSIENITLHNTRGHNILGNAGSNYGSASLILLNDITGNYRHYHVGRHGISIKDIFTRNQGNTNQKLIFSRIESIVSTIHTLPFEEQKSAHDEIARLQKEIFAEVEK